MTTLRTLPCALAVLAVTSSLRCNSDPVVPPSSGDSTPPVASITYPPNSVMIYDSVMVTASAEDENSVTKLEFYVDDSLVATLRSSPWQFSWNVRRYPPYSSHRVRARAFDFANNVGYSPDIEVMVNRTPTPLLSNGSFELNGVGTFEGWLDLNATRSNDVPPGGGLYSAALLNAWVFAGRLRSMVLVHAVGTRRYRLSAFAKASRGSPGFMGFQLQRGGVVIRGKGCIVQDTVWTMYSLVDTFSTTFGDTISVGCSGDGSQFGDNRYSLFDLFKLEELL